MTYLIELLRGLNEKTHVMSEGGTHTLSAAVNEAGPDFVCDFQRGPGG